MINLSSFSLYPIYDISIGNFVDGNQFKLPPKCQQCKTRECLSSIPIKTNIVYCHEGYGYLPLNQYGFTIIGLITENSRPNVFRYFKNKQQFITSEERVYKLIDSLNFISKNIDDIVQKQIKNITSSVHDIKAMSSAIYRTLEEECASQNINYTNDEELQKNKPHLFRLSKLAKVWTERIEIMEILSDPTKASLGQKKEQKIYAFVDKYIKLLQPMADVKGCHIHKEGNTFSTKKVFDSFGTIPFILLDNAIKYSYRSKTINVNFMELPTDSLIISITTFSPTINSSEIENIFERNVRGRNAIRLGVQGSGLGLHLAKTVADANNIKLSCEVLENGKTSIDNIEYGFVKFKIEI